MADDDDQLETWEIQVRGTVWTRVRNPEIPGAWRTIRANGAKGPRRLTLTAAERRHNQALIPEDNQHLDPFTNGALQCVAGSPKDLRAWLTDEELGALLALEDQSLFETEVAAISTELTLRRLLDLAERLATVPRFEFVRSLVQARYAVGGTQRAVQEMIDAGERVAGFRS